jgi:O-antigen ligase
MDLGANNKYLGSYVLATSVAVCLLVTPLNSIDPVSLPKLCLLVVLSFIGVGFAFSNVEFFRTKKNRLAVSLIGLFLAQLFLVFLLDDQEFSLRFYGTFGRNTGLIAYVSLSFLLLASLVSASKEMLKRYAVAILGVGAALAIYGVSQSKGNDFYQFNNAYETNVFGTFGNPNFQSAFMGIVAAVALTVVLYGKIRIILKATLVLLIFIALYNISLSSQQGYLNFAAGFAFATVIFLLKSKRPFLGWIVAAISGASGILIGLGILNIGPLADFIYKSSLQARGFYWRAAAKMMFEHPFFGLGMDGYGDAYFRSRTSEIASANAGITADSAHNIPLDIGASGGFPLLLAYISIIALVAMSIVSVIKRQTEFDIFFTAIVTAWVAYQVQSFISINQLGLGVWGWSLSGLIIGYELNTRSDSVGIIPKSVRPGNLKTQRISALAVVFTFVAASIGIAIAAPPYIAANSFYKALQSGDPSTIQQSAYLKPFDRMRYLYVAQALQENKFESGAINVLRDATAIYPDTIELWRRWASIQSASASDIARAKAEMKRLDPFNPELE